MMMLSKKLFYAVEAVLSIGCNAQAEPVSSKEVAEWQGLPPRYLEQIMQKLVRANILRGIRGPKGGYLLARERRKITVAEICRILLEGESSGEPDSDANTPLGQRVIAPLCGRINERMMQELEDITIAHLCEQAANENIQTRPTQKMDFTI